ncbi:MAG: hypothetical protein K2K83_03590 [Rikenella sp.]|nr:hypothetical protein [Rikenella sp.]
MGGREIRDPPPVFCTPAPGYRYRGFGTLYAIGNGGYCWSSTIPTAADVDSRAYCLDLNCGGFNPNSNNYCAYGFQLRCLQE